MKAMLSELQAKKIFILIVRSEVLDYYITFFFLISLERVCIFSFRVFILWGFVLLVAAFVNRPLPLSDGGWPLSAIRSRGSLPSPSSGYIYFLFWLYFCKVGLHSEKTVRNSLYVGLSFCRLCAYLLGFQFSYRCPWLHVADMFEEI